MPSEGMLKDTFKRKLKIRFEKMLKVFSEKFEVMLTSSKMRVESALYTGYCSTSLVPGNLQDKQRQIVSPSVSIWMTGLLPIGYSI